MQNSKSLKIHGFTLIESLVAITIFIIAVTSATGLFVVYSRAQENTRTRQQAMSQLSFVLEKMAQEIRLKRINFFDTNALFRFSSLYSLDGSDGISGSELELGLMDENKANKEVYFFAPKSSPALISCAGYLGHGILHKYSAARCEPLLNAGGVEVTNVSFYIWPDKNPYPSQDGDCFSGNFNDYQCICSDDDQCSGKCLLGVCLETQPSVTVAIEVQILGEAPITVQTTSASRQYAK